jgi:uncharacterized protein YecE (DUF72 family)
MTRFLYGTSSWSERSWEGVFYPKGMAPGDYLAHYAGRFATVEADSTYYRLPDRRMVQGWARKTPDGFVLSAKFTRTIVHGGDAATPDPAKLLTRDAVGADVDRFLEAMSELGPKCGPLVLQFPYFNLKAFKSAAPFLERLDAFLGTLPKSHRYAVEIRNKNWLGEPLLSVLKRHATALVLVDLAYMPHPEEVAESLDIVTTDFTYGRLIGDRKAIEAVTKTFDRIVVDMAERLERWVRMLRRLGPRIPVAYLYANNHYAGFGPTTIEQLRGMMESAGA